MYSVMIDLSWLTEKHSKWKSQNCKDPNVVALSLYVKSNLGLQSIIVGEE